MCLFSMAQLWSVQFTYNKSVESLIDSVNRNLASNAAGEDTNTPSEPDYPALLDAACGSLEKLATPDAETDVTALLIEHSTCIITEIGNIATEAN